jgi:UDP-N-acetylmuramoyl-tripeptide--D-alanyl-D-alanine ligase
MMPSMYLTDAAQRFGGTVLNPDSRFTSVSIDSRQVKEGDLFVAIEGENFDAHSFISSVSGKISGVVVSKADLSSDLPQWIVGDTTKALGDLAKLRRDSFQGCLIAITGSSGKTSVKESVLSILSQTNKVHGTKGNLNNHFGVPLTLLAMDSETEIAVIEMGASSVGEIEYLCSIASPDIALINNAQTAHIEGFGSVEAIAKAKGEIYSSLGSSGIAVINLDQLWKSDWLDIVGDRPCITFSIDDTSADIFAKDITDLGGAYFSFVLCLNSISSDSSKECFITLTVPGLHAVSNALASAACAIAAGANLDNVASGLKSVVPIAGRLHRTLLQEKYTIIDDSYNANPESFVTAIDVLSSSSGYRILVMGDMGELGDRAIDLHRQVGSYAKRSKIQSLFSVGSLSQNASDEFSGYHFKTKNSLVDGLCGHIKAIRDQGNEITILVKGSRSARMEQVVKALTSREKIPC